MTSFNRIAETGEIVKITTIKGEEFIGKIHNQFFITEENGVLDCEIYISEVEKFSSDYGCVGLPIAFIQSVEKVSI